MRDERRWISGNTIPIARTAHEEKEASERLRWAVEAGMRRCPHAHILGRDLPRTPIDFATVADPDDEHEENRLAYLVEDPIIPDPQPIEIVCASE